MSDCVKDLFTVAVANGKLPPFFDSIIYDGKSAEVIPSHGYGENSFAVKGKHDLSGKDVKFKYKGEDVI